MRGRNVRREMSEAAAKLLARRGLEGTSIGAVLDAVRAPRGSVYHHFPGGKQELISAALTRVQSRMKYALAELSGEPATVVVERYLEMWERVLEESGMMEGSAVLAVTVAAGDDIELLNQTGVIYEAWAEQLARLLIRGGIREEEGHQLATLVIAACEGAVAIARAESGSRAFWSVSRSLAAITAQALARGDEARALGPDDVDESDWDPEDID